MFLNSPKILVNPFVPNVPCSTSWEHQKTLSFFWCFQGAEKEPIGSKQVNAKHIPSLRIEIFEENFILQFCGGESFHKKINHPQFQTKLISREVSS